jgi:hypothetical protein
MTGQKAKKRPKAMAMARRIHLEIPKNSDKPAKTPKIIPCLDLNGPFMLVFDKLICVSFYKWFYPIQFDADGGFPALISGHQRGTPKTPKNHPMP